MPRDKEHFRLNRLIEQYRDAVKEAIDQDHDRSEKLVTKLLKNRHEDLTDDAIMGMRRVIISSWMMFETMLNKSVNTKHELFFQLLISRCLDYYVENDELITDKLYSEYGTGVLIDDVYIISVIFSWLKEDFDLNHVLSHPEQTLRIILGNGLADELDTKAREIFNESLERAM